MLNCLQCRIVANLDFFCLFIFTPKNIYNSHPIVSTNSDVPECAGIHDLKCVTFCVLQFMYIVYLNIMFCINVLKSLMETTIAFYCTDNV